MNSIQLHQKANELVQIIGSRDIRNITRSLGMQVSEMPFDSILGFFTFQWEFHQVVINDKLDKATKQMVVMHSAATPTPICSHPKALFVK